MTFFEKMNEKIKSKWIAKIIALIVAIMVYACIIGFFALPFIKYSESSKNIFLCLWIFCTAIFSVFAFAFYKYDFKNNKKEIEEYEKDKVVYLVGRIGIAIYFVGVFLLIFLVRNNFLSLSTTATIGFCVMGLLLLGTVIALLTQYKNNYKQMAKDTFRFLYLFFVIVFCSVVLFTGMLIHENDNIPQYYSQILISLGAIPLLLGGIYLTCKLFLSNKMFGEKSDGLPISIVLFIAIGIIACIVLKYVVSDKELQQIMTTIFAAILGGAITLGGVAWTIKKGDMDRQSDLKRIEEERKEEERKKHTPFLKLISNKTNSITKVTIEANLLTDNYVVLSQPSTEKYCEAEIQPFNLKNISESIILLLGIKIDDKFCEFEENVLLEKDSICNISPQNKTLHLFEKIPSNIELIVSDVLGNKYKLCCNFKLEQHAGPHTISSPPTSFTYIPYQFTIENVSFPEQINKKN